MNNLPVILALLPLVLFGLMEFDVYRMDGFATVNPVASMF